MSEYKLILLLVFFGGCIATVKTTNQDIQYEFVGACSLHKVDRHFFNDTVFVDIHSIKHKAGQYSVSDTFKVIGDEWYYMRRDSFYKYLPIEEFKSGTESLVFHKSAQYLYDIYKPKSVEQINGKEVYVYSVIFPIEESFGRNERIFYFDRDFGIIKTENPMNWGCHTQVVKILN